MTDFLGKGLVSPFKRSGSIDFENAEGFELVKASVRETLGTIGDSPFASGELPWRTEFGAALNILKHRNLGDDVSAEARILVERALANHNPRVQIVTVEADAVHEENRLKLRVFIAPITEDVPANQVFLQGENQPIEVVI